MKIPASKKLKKIVQPYLYTPFGEGDHYFHVDIMSLRRKSLEGIFVPSYVGEIVTRLPPVRDFNPFSDDKNPKYISMKQRYVLGYEWMDTDLFRLYALQLASGEVPRGCGKIDDLVLRYSKYDELFRVLQTCGFSTQPEHRLYVHVAGSGEFVWTTDGNHRLGLAIALGFKEIPVSVWLRERDWQLTRQAAYAVLRRGGSLDEELMKHPDMAAVIAAATKGRCR